MKHLFLSLFQLFSVTMSEFHLTCKVFDFEPIITCIPNNLNNSLTLRSPKVKKMAEI